MFIWVETDNHLHFQKKVISYETYTWQRLLALSVQVQLDSLLRVEQKCVSLQQSDIWSTALTIVLFCHFLELNLAVTRSTTFIISADSAKTTKTDKVLYT